MFTRAAPNSWYVYSRTSFLRSLLSTITSSSKLNIVGECPFSFHFYRPQRSWAKVMFLQVCVILFTGGCLPQCMLGYHPPGADTPQDQIPPRSRSPLEQTPSQDQTPLGKQTPAYGQRAAGTHPTGMHSCFIILLGSRPVSHNQSSLPKIVLL